MWETSLRCLLLLGLLLSQSKSVENEAYLAISCPYDAQGNLDYINSFETKTCTCELFDPGNAPGQARWIHPLGVVIVEGTKKVDLELGYNTKAIVKCDDGWIVDGAGESCLKLDEAVNTGAKVFSTATTSCGFSNADLLMIKDARKQEFVKNAFVDLNINTAIWLDAERNSAGTDFEWNDDDDTPFSYKNWMDGMPNGASGSEDCVGTVPAQDFKWNDLPCNVQKYTVCEKNAVVKDNQNQVYKCEGTTSYGQELSLNVTARFAFGPTSVTHVDPAGHSFTPNLANGPEVAIDCVVSNDAIPFEPVVQLKVGDTTHSPVGLNFDDVDNQWTANFQFNPLPGTYSSSCIASNANPGGNTVTSSFTLDVHGVPTVELDGCDSLGFIKENDAKECDCKITVAGYPVVEAAWRFEGSDIASGDPVASYSWHLRAQHNKDYGCTAVGLSVEVPPKIFKPQIAYGPDSITAAVVGANDYNVKTATAGQTIQVTCTVPTSFNPDVTVSLKNTPIGTMNGGAYTSTIQSERVYAFDFEPDGVGDFNVQCYAENTQFPELNITSSDLLIHVYDDPTVGLGGDCPMEGDQPTLIASGDIKTCTCVLVNAGNPPAPGAFWEGEGSSVLSLFYDPNRVSNTFTCKAESSEGFQDTTTYTAEYAYLTAAPTSSAVSPALINLCPEAARTVTFDCELDSTKVNPGANFEITAPSGATQESSVDNSDPNILRKTYTFSVHEGKPYKFICTVINSKFSFLNVSVPTNEIEVYEPPTSPPKVFTREDDNIRILATTTHVVSIGETFDLTCVQEGGYPAESTVNFACGGQSTGPMTNSGRFSLTATRDLNQANCTCTASHDSGCGDFNIWFSLDVRYPANITSFTANSSPADSITVPAGTLVNFECTSEGNLVPVMSMTSQISQRTFVSQTLPPRPFEGQFAVSIPTTLEHTDVYTCSSENGGELQQRDITLYVEGPPQLYKSQQRTFTVVARSGETITMSFNIISRPPPSQHSLMRSMVYDGTFESRPLPVDMYKVTTNEVNIQYMEVQLNFNDDPYFTDPYYSDQSYILTIGNGLGELNITLHTTVEEESEDSDENVSSGLIVGCVVGGVFVLTLVALGIAYCYHQGQKGR